ncbi:hypothetical protein B0H10DRAFT_2440375 [Mycena sp. CBHHK59/15]|nr:hypothetical protein B0H10DRAFT_2440375 [Mycena sp. CBHHK59/15]
MARRALFAAYLGRQAPRRTPTPPPRSDAQPIRRLGRRQVRGVARAIGITARPTPSISTPWHVRPPTPWTWDIIVAQPAVRVRFRAVYCGASSPSPPLRIDLASACLSLATCISRATSSPIHASDDRLRLVSSIAPPSPPASYLVDHHIPSTRPHPCGLRPRRGCVKGMRAPARSLWSRLAGRGGVMHDRSPRTSDASGAITRIVPSPLRGHASSAVSVPIALARYLHLSRPSVRSPIPAAAAPRRHLLRGGDAQVPFDRGCRVLGVSIFSRDFGPFFIARRGPPCPPASYPIVERPIRPSPHLGGDPVQSASRRPSPPPASRLHGGRFSVAHGGWAGVICVSFHAPSRAIACVSCTCIRATACASAAEVRARRGPPTSAFILPRGRASLAPDARADWSTIPTNSAPTATSFLSAPVPELYRRSPPRLSGGLHLFHLRLGERHVSRCPAVSSSRSTRTHRENLREVRRVRVERGPDVAAVRRVCGHRLMIAHDAGGWIPRGRGGVIAVFYLRASGRDALRARPAPLPCACAPLPDLAGLPGADVARAPGRDARSSGWTSASAWTGDGRATVLVPAFVPCFGSVDGDLRFFATGATASVVCRAFVARRTL